MDHSFTQTKERIQKLKETGDTSYIYKKELDKAFFQHDMAYGLYQRGLASMVYKFFDKKSKGGGLIKHANDKIKQNQRSLDLAAHQLAEELHKPIIRKFEKRTVYSGFKDNI